MSAVASALQATSSSSSMAGAAAVGGSGAGVAGGGGREVLVTPSWNAAASSDASRLDVYVDSAAKWYTVSEICFLCRIGGGGMDT